MELPREGTEYAHIRFYVLPEGAAVEASTDRATWLATDPGADPLERLLLLRGPDAPVSSAALVTGSCSIWVRVDDDLEHVIRRAGSVNLV